VFVLPCVCLFVALLNSSKFVTHPSSQVCNSHTHAHTHKRTYYTHVFTNIRNTHTHTHTHTHYVAHTAEVWSTNTEITYKLFVTLSNLGLLVTNKKLLTQSSYTWAFSYWWPTSLSCSSIHLLISTNQLYQLYGTFHCTSYASSIWSRIQMLCLHGSYIIHLGVMYVLLICINLLCTYCIIRVFHPQKRKKNTFTLIRHHAVLLYIA